MKLDAKRITYDAMLAALCAVLGYVSIDAGNLKFSIESMPILFGALCFGAADAAVIALVGTFISQLLMYGLSATTILWMIPPFAASVLAGICSSKCRIELSKKNVINPVIITELTLIVLNSAALFADSKIYGYYSAVYILGSIPWRILVSAIRSIVYIIILPPLLKAVRKVL